MNGATIDSVAAIQAFVRDTRRIHVQGAGTKTALAPDDDDCAVLNLSKLSGIIDYEPQEYTFTAYAATRVTTLISTLAEHDQFLPFDPLLNAEGSTIGGTIAANLSGSRRYHYGGVRDFILGATVVDGAGNYFRCGGKVVKNAAGFDLAKFYVGSLGRYGVLVDVTFKVFPHAPTFETHRLSYATLQDAIEAVYYINQQPYELDALDIEPSRGQWSLLVRIGGPADTLPARATRLVETLRKNTTILDDTPVDDAATWSGINSFAWATSPHMVKVPVPPRQVAVLDERIARGDMQRRYSVGGNIAWVATEDVAELDNILQDEALTGLHFLGAPQKAIIGKPLEGVFSGRVKAVLDPENKFV